MSVEESVQDIPTLVWFKSSYSGSEGGQCVEVAACPGTVHVRDSKDTSGPNLSFDAERWTAFVAYATHR